MGARAVVILIAVWTTIQGCAYGILSILALLAHDCQISMKQSRLSYLMYIIYFRDRKCGLINWNIVSDVPPPFTPTWPAVTEVAHRTNVLALVYLILSSIWIITSLMLIVGSFTSHLGRAGYFFLIVPWAFFSALTATFDVVATCFFFYDLFNTLNMESFLRHLQLTNTSTEFQSLEINASILPLPAVIMLIVASRGFLIWCLNILSIPIVLSKGHFIIFGGKRKSDASARQDFTYERNQSSTNNNILENHFPATAERSRYSDPSHYHHYQYDNMSYHQDKYDLSQSIGRRYIEPLKDKSHDGIDHAKSVTRNSSPEEKSSKKSSWSGESQNSSSTVHLASSYQPTGAASTADLSKHRSWRDLSSEAVLKIERPHFRLPNKPSLLKKLSDSSYVMPEEPPVAVHASEELRSQLPWSYFHGRQEAMDPATATAIIKKPKKSFNELRDDEDLPPVPVPDYSVNLSRKNRTVSDTSAIRRPTPAKKFINPKRGSSHDDGHWSGPEYRY